MTNERQLILSRKEQLLLDLRDSEYRRGFVEGHAKDTIAFQLRKLRKAKGWEQRDVAKGLGNPKLQPMISRYENPDYGRYSINTLLELASVFDVALVVRLAPFSELVEWDWSCDAGTLCPPSFDKDEGLIRIGARIHNEQRFSVESQPNSRLGPIVEVDKRQAGQARPMPLAPGTFGGDSSPSHKTVAGAGAIKALGVA